ncbi:MAG: hypothetical protein DI527_16340 [Chelatococcus sp.]|nr:MAG: hypothetical protein DI527_16340 [Chelatococcus sp.]
MKTGLTKLACAFLTLFCPLLAGSLLDVVQTGAGTILLVFAGAGFGIAAAATFLRIERAEG